MSINWLIRALILTSFWAATIWAQDGSAALVRVAQAEMKNIAPVTLVPGTVISRDDARVAAEVSGRLMDVAEVGDDFKAGEVVARIDDTRFKLLKTELAADITRAEAQVRFLEGEEKRFAKLAESNLAATTQLEQTRSERDVSLADLEVARSRLAQNEDQLARTRIRAPFSGIVVERLKTPGERVSEGELVVRLVDHNRLEVVARAPLDYYSFTHPGQTLEVRSSRQTTMARVRTVVAVGDQDTHQFELRLDLETGPFPVGQTVRVAVPFDEQREALTVPRDALVLRPEGQTVFVVNGDNEAKRVEVTTGVGSGADIEVFGDIHAGDTVVIRGNERLQAGQSVTIIEG
jgi:RND family efflux transporter MFP subunit